MTTQKQGKGWHNEQARHALSAKGISTKTKLNALGKGKPYEFRKGLAIGTLGGTNNLKEREGVAEYKKELKEEKEMKNPDLLPDLDTKKLDDFYERLAVLENDEKKYAMTGLQRVEFYKQLQAMGLVNSRSKLYTNNGLVRINKGSTNVDVGYDAGLDTYVVFVIKNDLKNMDFKVKQHNDVYVEDLPNYL